MTRGVSLRTLGTAEVRDADGRELAVPVTQPKRLALLAYLVLATPTGFHRRDTLLAMFWPESDTDRARGALRQAVRYLRRLVGEGVIVSRGEEELGIAPGSLWCDALELRRALERGDDAEALALYAGELLPGLFVTGAPGFEGWITGERARLSAGAAAAAARVSHARRLVPLDPACVIVEPLENRTGVAEFDILGKMTADWIAQALATASDVSVSSSGGAGAGTAVGGAYYLAGNELRFAVRVADLATGRLLPGPEPVTVDRATPLEAMDELGRRVLACVAPLVSRDAGHARHASRPPTYVAYRAYLDGLERFTRGDWAASLAHFRNASALEPDYALPRIVAAIAHWNLGELHSAMAAARDAQQHAHTVGRFERAVLAMVLAWLRGDWAAAYDAARIQAELAPGSIPHFGLAEEARRLGRVREARTILSRLDPTRGELKEFVFYAVELTTAHHMLGDHAGELEAAVRAHELHGDHPVARLLEVRARAALGQVDAVERLLAEGLASPDRREPRPGALLREAALELQAHGHGAAAVPLFAESAAWYAGQVGAVENGVAMRRGLARALYLAGRLDESDRELLGLADGSGDAAPVAFHHAHLQGHLDEGYLAVIAARRGRMDAVEHWRGRLEAMQRPFLFGSSSLWLAAVAAVLGEPERAVSLLRRAFADGLPREMFLHTDPHLALLRGYQPFDSLVRPR